METLFGTSLETDQERGKSSNGHQHFEKESAGFGSYFPGLFDTPKQSTQQASHVRWGPRRTKQRSCDERREPSHCKAKQQVGGGLATLKASNLVKQGRDEYW